MRIGLVCPYNIAKGGGVQEVVRALCTGLNQNGHYAKIITPQPKDTENADLSDVIFIGGAADIYSPMHTVAQVSASASGDYIDEVLEFEKFDVLHFHEPWIPMLSRQILTHSRSVNVATFHAKIPETIMSQSLMKAVTPYLKSVLKYVDDITAVSEAAAEYIGTLTDQPITIIPNGINLNTYKFRAEDQSKPKKMILYIGRLERRKGVKYLLKAYYYLVTQRDDVELVVAGDGPDRLKLEAMAADLQLPNVSFLGYVSEAEKQTLLATADVFCSPAIFGESFGIVLLEAIASGVPVVAGNNPGYTSVLQGVGALSLVKPQDSEDFARRLNTFLGEPAVRKLWRDWAKTYVKQFAYPTVVKQYEEAYAAALESRVVTPRLALEDDEPVA